MTAAEQRPGTLAEWSARQWSRVPHRDVVISSGSLFGSTAITSGLGFAYWSLVARTAPAASVGAASTLVSALTLLGAIGMFGFGTMLIAELSRDPRRVRDLLPASLAAAAVLSFVLAVLFIVGSLLVSPALRSALDTPANLGLFASGVVLSAVTYIFDQASVGLAIAQTQLWRNSWFSLIKVLLIPAIALCGGPVWSILGSWILGLALSMLLILPNLRRRKVLAMNRPRLSALTGLGWVTAHHNLLNLSMIVPRMAIPVVVGMFQPGEATAAFYAAWMIAGFLYAAPTHLATSLFAIAAGDTASLHSKIRMTLRVSAGFGLVAVPAVALLATPIMLVFGHMYAASGSGCLVVLALLYPTRVIQEHYAAVLRVRGQVRRAGIVCCVAAVIELGTVVAAATRGGLAMIAGAQGAVLVLESLVMAPVVFRALRPQAPVAPDPHRLDPIPRHRTD